MTDRAEIEKLMRKYEGAVENGYKLSYWKWCELQAINQEKAQEARQECLKIIEDTLEDGLMCNYIPELKDFKDRLTESALLEKGQVAENFKDRQITFFANSIINFAFSYDKKKRIMYGIPGGTTRNRRKAVEAWKLASIQYANLKSHKNKDRLTEGKEKPQ